MRKIIGKNLLLGIYENSFKEIPIKFTVVLVEVVAELVSVVIVVLGVIVEYVVFSLDSNVEYSLVSKIVKIWVEVVIGLVSVVVLVVEEVIVGIYEVVILLNKVAVEENALVFKIGVVSGVVEIVEEKEFVSLVVKGVVLKWVWFSLFKVVDNSFVKVTNSI